MLFLQMNLTFFGYSYYLPRIDLVTINRLGEVEVVPGEPADIPQAPILADDAMEIAQVKLSCISVIIQLKNPESSFVIIEDSRCVISENLRSRIETLEELTVCHYA